MEALQPSGPCTTLTCSSPATVLPSAKVLTPLLSCPGLRTEQW